MHFCHQNRARWCWYTNAKHGPRKNIVIFLTQNAPLSKLCTRIYNIMYMHFLTGRGWLMTTDHSKTSPSFSMCNIPEQWGHVRKWLDWFPANRPPNSEMLFTSHLSYSNSAPVKTLATQHTCDHACCPHPCPSSAKHTC